MGPGTAGGGWTSATNHLMIPETPGKSPTLPATPMMQRMALQATGTYKKGYQVRVSLPPWGRPLGLSMFTNTNGRFT